MKRGAILITILLVLAAGLLVLIAPIPLAVLPESDAALAVNTAGETYLAHNQNGRSAVLTVAPDGNITAIYSENARRTGEEATAITALSAAQDKVYFVRARGGTGGGDYTSWDLAALDPKTGAAETLFHTQETVPPAGLNVADGVAYAAVVGTQRLAGEAVDTVIGCRVDLTGDAPEIEILHENSVPDGARATTAVSLSDGSVVAALSNGHLLHSGASDVSYLNETGDFSALYAAGDYLWCGNAAGEALRGVNLRLTAAPVDGAVLCGAATRDGGAAMLTFADGGVRLTRESASETLTFDALGLPVGVRVQQRLFACGAAMLAMLVVCLVAGLLIWTVRRRKRLRLRLTAAGVCVSLVLCVAMLVATLHISRTELENQRMVQAGQAAARMAQTVVDGMPEGWSETIDTGVNEVRTLYAFYPVSGGALEPPVGESALCSAGQSYRMAEAALSAGEGRREIGDLTGRSAALAALPVRQYEKVVGVIVTAQLARDLSAQLADVRHTVLVATLVVLVLFSVCFFLLLRRGLEPMCALASRMDDLAVGRTALEEVSCADDELGAMWRNLKELSVGMAIRDYETRSTLEACRRFVPRGLDKLLGRSTITEVSFGDSATISGPVGLITVNNGNAARDHLSDNDFMCFVNDCFAAINRNIRPLDGILLTAGFDLKSLRVFYPGGADSGMQSALHLLGEQGETHMDDVPAPDFFILLHPFRLLYGIAGTEDEAFPYISSAELEFFSSYAQHFAAAGCRMVLTDPYRAEMEETCTTRYIGFIASSDGQYIYKLYEVLDSYSDLEKKRREQYDGRLQEAIACFYKNDFYLARSLFLAVLRLNPDDGIARWYLFASEHYFNNSTGEEPRYDLFGIHE